MRFTRVIKFGDRGNEVSYLQAKLFDLGFYRYEIDGIFGHQTNFAVLAFQKSVNIKQDGVVGMMTWSQLVSEPESIEQPGNRFSMSPSVITTDFKIYDYYINDNYLKSDTKDNLIIKGSLGSYRPDQTIDTVKYSYLRNKKGNIISDSIKQRISTNYVIGSISNSGDETWDGVILRAFDDMCWSRSIAIDSDLESKSISITLCNFGPLSFGRDAKFYNLNGQVIADSHVVEIPEEYRGYRFFKKYTNAQLESLQKLLIYLKHKYEIDTSNFKCDYSWFNYNPSTKASIKNSSQFNLEAIDVFPQLELIQVLNSID